MREFILDVRNFRVEGDSFSCNLIANNRKAAFVAPGTSERATIFEWSSQSLQVDVLEWFGKAYGLETQRVKITQVDWQAEIPDFKFGEERHERLQAQMLRWVRVHHRAYLFSRMKDRVFMTDTLGNLSMVSRDIDSSHLSGLERVKSDKDTLLAILLAKGDWIND